MKYINNTPRWLYRLLFIISGVRFLRNYNWPMIDAWAMVSDEFDNGDESRHIGYSPSESVVIAISYWD